MYSLSIFRTQHYPTTFLLQHAALDYPGRVRAGHCWRVYSEEFFSCSRVLAFSVPEIQRVPLEDVVLQVLLLKLGRPEVFLQRCLLPPSADQLRASIQVLLDIKAVLPLD